MATPSERKVGYQQEPDDHRMSEPLDADADGFAEEIIGQDATQGGQPDKDRPPEPPAPGAD